MDKRTKSIYKFAIYALIENGHSFKLVSGKKKKKASSAVIAGIGASKNRKNSDTLTLHAYVTGERDGFTTAATVMDCGMQPEQDEADPEQEEQDDR